MHSTHESGSLVVHQNMAVAELNLLSMSWQMLIMHERESGWPVSDLMSLCRQVVKDKELASYLEPNAVDKFRRFLRERPDLFQYDKKLDKVDIAKNSQNAASERWLAKYLVLRILDGCCEVGEEASDRCLLVLPKCIADHLTVMYGGSLELFCRTHPSDFILDRSGAHLAQLTSSCCKESITSYLKEEGLIYFFIDLLHKIGATEAKPCPVHTLMKYTFFMSSSERVLLNENYCNNLNVFFFLNPANFEMTKAEKGSVYVKYRDTHYAAALFLRQQFNIQSSTIVSLGLELIGLFHLHPGIFDLSSVNRVSLHTTETPETLASELSNEQQIKNQAVEYAAKLLKYVGDLTPDLFRCCAEGLPGDVRKYCEEPVKGRLQSIIKSGRAALAANLPRTGIIATSEASTQTVTGPASLSLMCQPANEDTENKDEAHRINQRATTEVDKEIKHQHPAPTLHKASPAESCVLEAQGDVVVSTNARNGGAALSFVKADAAVHSCDQKVQTRGVACKKAGNQAVPTPRRDTSATQRRGKGYKSRVVVNSKKPTDSASPAKVPPSAQQVETKVILSKNARKRARKLAAATLHGQADVPKPNDSKAKVDSVVTERAAAAECVVDSNVACVDKQQAGQVSLVSSPSEEADSTGEASKTCVQSARQTGGGEEEATRADLECVAATSPSYLAGEAENSSAKPKKAGQPNAKESMQPNQQSK
ncbi:hypothetical protein MTO96_016669 [Rhipicephalus appendiculatus]